MAETARACGQIAWDLNMRPLNKISKLSGKLPMSESSDRNVIVSPGVTFFDCGKPVGAIVTGMVAPGKGWSSMVSLSSGID